VQLQQPHAHLTQPSLIIYATSQFQQNKLAEAEQLLTTAQSQEKHKNSPLLWQAWANTYQKLNQMDKYIDAVEKLAVILRDMEQRDRCEGVINRMLTDVKANGTPAQVQSCS
jgi:hypothetical protein